MTVSQNLFDNYYPTDWTHSLQSSEHSFIVPLHDHANLRAESARTLFAPSAGAMYVYHPSKRRRVLNRAIDKLEKGALPGYEYVIAHLYDKYRRNLTISTISQTGLTLYVFLSFLQTERRTVIEQISRKDIAAYVEHEHERGLKINSVKNHLQTVYAFIGYLVDNEILPLEILHKKIRIKLPEVLPKAIPDEDLKQILSNITTVRNRAIILLLLHTGMRIGELLNVKMADIILSENKILLPLGEKNLHGRIVYYSSAAEQALNQWLGIRKPDSDYLFYGYRGGELSYVIAWTIMKKAVQKAGLGGRGYSLHSLRHYVESDIMGSVG
jgi:integrase/recombinase XerD